MRSTDCLVFIGTSRTILEQYPEFDCRKRKMYFMSNSFGDRYSSRQDSPIWTICIK
jgi:hypothetical protein